MGAIKIDCYCTESQMKSIIDAVVSHLLNSDLSDIPDFDDTIESVRVCVEFHSFMNDVTLKLAEVMDSDWDLLYEDTAVLTSRLNVVLKDFNRNNKESIKQSQCILEDQTL